MREIIRRFSVDKVGFDDCRFADPFVDPYLQKYRAWLAAGHHGEMTYLERHLPFKVEPDRLLEGVRSAIVVIKNYKNTPERRLKQPFKVARYAAGRDYHLVMKEALSCTAAFIERERPDAKCYYGVDSRPLAERTLALRAGIGFLGKNAMVIKPGMGSYFFIGVILTTLPLPPDQPLAWDCGSCRLCLDACPTPALDTPYQVNATQCLSYQTIEQKHPMTDEQLQQSQGWLFGCDICQEVCPYNHDRIALTDWTALRPEQGVGFDVFEGDGGEPDIPKDTALYRSRKRIIPNWQHARKLAGREKV